MRPDEKASLRREALARRGAVLAAERARATRAIVDRVLDLPAWKAARTIASYVPIGSEIDTRPLLEAALASRRRLAVPRTRVAEHALALHEVASLDELSPGAFRVPEPDPALHADVPATEVDLLVVPGVAFDPTGHRLGYGRGYFDRLLAGFPGLAVGLAFEALLVPRVPAEAHDVRVDLVVTERRVVDASGAE